MPLRGEQQKTESPTHAESKSLIGPLNRHPAMATTVKTDSSQIPAIVVN